MSDKQTEEQASGAGAETGTEKTAAVKPTAPGKRSPQKPPAAGRRIWPWLLVVIMLAGLATGGWFGAQWLLAERADLLESLARQQQRTAQLEESLLRLHETAVDEARFQESQNTGAQAIATLHERMDMLAKAMEDLHDAAQGGRRDLMKAEIELLLRTAADELYLTGNVSTAVYSLTTADERLRQLGDPALNPVRERIAEHLVKLNSVTVPDKTGMAFKLGSLQRAVNALPLQQAAYARAETGTAATSDQESWWARAKAGADRLFGKLVTHRAAEPPPPLLTPDESFFLYRNLELQFAAARAALLQGEAAAYRQSLEMAREWLNNYFDVNNPDVRSMLADINGLLEVQLQPELPDITGALATFHDITGNGVRD